MARPSSNKAAAMDTGYLSQQVNSIIGQLHGLFDEIGVPGHERESREAELFTALSEALNNHVRQVSAEKKDLIAEAQKMITVIRQMEASLEDPRSRRNVSNRDDGLEVSYPLTKCIQGLKEKHSQVRRVHQERFEQVKKLVVALESYSSHLEPSFVKIALPPTGPNQSIPPNFDISSSYVDSLDQEFTRVYEEYERRVEMVKSTCETIIQLWAELGTPQAQTDGAIVKYYRDAPEQLGLHEEDLARLHARREKLETEKKNREQRLRDLKEAVEVLWDKLGIEEKDRKAFLNANRGCGVRQINEFGDELARLNELKRQNLHLFVEDARCKLQELWDALYMSEDEMLEFTPAFSDVYSDALLEAHEQEIARLEILREQRAPTLAMVEKHRSLVAERDELAASSQDASRLMMKGQKGEKRDPGKLLREEKMRKRIAKELPKVTAELRKTLEQWEDEWGRPFCVHGERYLDAIELEDRPAPGPRSRTPANTSMPSRPNTAPKSAPAAARSNSVISNTRSQAPSRTGAKTPTSAVFSSLPTKRGQPPAGISVNTKGSPTRIPARAPLSNLTQANNIPDKSVPAPDKLDGLRRGAVSALGNVPLMRAPPPKMRDLHSVPETETPTNHHRHTDLGSSIVRHIEPEDVYDDRPKASSGEYERPGSHHSFSDYGKASLRYGEDQPRPLRLAQSLSNGSQTQRAPAIRQISNESSNSNSTVITGSENWETYDDNSEPEDEVPGSYYAKVRESRNGDSAEYAVDPYARYSMGAQQTLKRLRGIPPAQQPQVMVDEDGNRIFSGSEWTDEDAGY
ncbi:Microtubule bundling protein [Gnomoniopsis smithogilvyi]|uniref:Microtubule bundling protein n=1 Tax=Gnomoniopsis smithogilvyi TaxID=1191159 RepID=A0A9W9CWP6_9PEZI|nr:Microtubule bundling protein [Gnomoniopsis smithogilvyi]